MKKTLGNVKLYSSIYTEEEKKAIANYSKLFDFDSEIKNELKKDGMELSNQSLMQEIKINRNPVLNTIDDLEAGYYEADKASDRITGLVASGAIRKDFLSQQFNKAVMISRINELKGIENDIISTLNPTLDKVNSRVLKQDDVFNSILSKAREAKARYDKNYNTKDKKQIEELYQQAIEYIA